MNLPEIVKAIRAILQFIANEDKISPQMKEAASALFTEIRTLAGLSDKIKDGVEPDKCEEPDDRTVPDKKSETASYSQQAYDAYLTLTSYFTSEKPKDETDKA